MARSCTPHARAWDIISRFWASTSAVWAFWPPSKPMRWKAGTLVHGEYILDRRSILSVSVDGQNRFRQTALNDVVISKSGILSDGRCRDFLRRHSGQPLPGRRRGHRNAHGFYRIFAFCGRPGAGCSHCRTRRDTHLRPQPAQSVHGVFGRTPSARFAVFSVGAS